MQTMTLFSDYICPFCFIGKRRVERLVEELPIEPFWKGFEIHPEVPPGGIPITRFMPEMISNLEVRVRMLADEIGLEIRMPAKLSNSRMALLGGEFAREADRFHEYHEAVFSAYFQQGKDIGDAEILVEIVDGIGIDGSAFREAIVNEKHAGTLAASLREAHSLGLTAVPSFVFADGRVIVGARPYDELKAAAEKSLQALR
ncbi:MAG: DsbA family oxidoreductase [Candidatus Hydrogenedentota bacterium]|nr:MAG: DsbA family oxidoreductase [Candidatus Hydrogenedentota bacterium]